MFLKAFAVIFWNQLSDKTHLVISNLFSKFFDSKISRLIILPYCFIYGLSDEYLDQFNSESGNDFYISYNDFFKRKYKTKPEVNEKINWPCEGYICDWGLIHDKEISLVKGQSISPRGVFRSNEIPGDYFFTNIFLHNHNYHRIHSPISGKIVSISRIPGSLTFLRPWFYSPEFKSMPALRNERVNIEILDSENNKWYLSLVGGFGVGTIKLNPQISDSSYVQSGAEIAMFELGSTVCMATPVRIQVKHDLQRVSACQPISYSHHNPSKFVFAADNTI